MLSLALTHFILREYNKSKLIYFSYENRRSI